MKTRTLLPAVWIAMLALCGSAMAQTSSTTATTRAIAAITAQARSAGYSTVTVAKGNHYADWPLWLSFKPYVRYQFSFDPSAIYQHPDQDQLDWNKLPGFTDCGSLEMSRNGAMFGWRWAPQTRKLQITAYANRQGVHQSADSSVYQNQVQMVEIDETDLNQFAPLTYDLRLNGSNYNFTIQGTLPSGRIISATSVLPRACTSQPWIKEGSTLYFGGTKTAPHTVTGHLKWLAR
jgi:hypothetical protein